MVWFDGIYDRVVKGRVLSKIMRRCCEVVCD